MELQNHSLEGYVQISAVKEDYLHSTRPVALRIIRQATGEANRVKIMEKVVSSWDDLAIEYKDYGARSQQEYTYTVEYWSNNGVESYVSDTVKSEIDGILITDGEKTYVTVAGASYSPQRNFTSAVVQPYYSRYPHMIVNGQQNYDSGTVEGYFNSFDNCALNDFNAHDAEELIDFLTSHKPKVLKTFDGICQAVYVTSDSQISYAKGSTADMKLIRFAYKQIGGDDKVNEILYG